MTKLQELSHEQIVDLVRFIARDHFKPETRHLSSNDYLALIEAGNRLEATAFYSRKYHELASALNLVGHHLFSPLSSTSGLEHFAPAPVGVPIEIRTDDPYNGQWRVADDVDDRENLDVPEGEYILVRRAKH